MEKNLSRSELVKAGKQFLLRRERAGLSAKARNYALRKLAEEYPEPYRKYKEEFQDQHTPTKDIDFSTYSEEILARLSLRKWWPSPCYWRSKLSA